MVDYILSIDLGQATDPAAAAVLHRCWWRPGERPIPETAKLWHEVPLLHTWPLGTPYPQIVDDISQQYAYLWREHQQMGVRLIVDQGGPGRPVIDELRRKQLPDGSRMRPMGITLTGGESPRLREEQDGTQSLTVPKRDICSALVVAMHSGDVKVAPELGLTAEYEKQLGAFGYRINRDTGTQTYESQQAQVHDDLVVAVAMGLWYSTLVLSRRFPGISREPDISPRYDPLARRA